MVFLKLFGHLLRLMSSEIKIHRTMMSRFKFILALVLTVVMTLSCVTVSKSRVTESRKVPAFNTLLIGAPASVHFTQGEPRGIKIVAPQSVIDQLTTKVVEGQLVVKYNKRHFRSSDIDIYITAPTLDGIVLNGTGDFECQRLSSERPVSMTLTGAGDIAIKELLCPAASLNLTGAGDIDLAFAKCGMVTCQVSGAGDIKLAGEVRGLKKSIAGVGDINTSKLSILDRQ